MQDIGTLTDQDNDTGNAEETNQNRSEKSMNELSTDQDKDTDTTYKRK